MDATQFPDIKTMTVSEAKEYLLKSISKHNDSHDLDLDPICRSLLDAAKIRRQASEHILGRTSITYYSSGPSEESPYTSVIYDAAWELVLEGVLRPGPIYFGVLNERKTGFSLTAAGKKKLCLS